MQDLIEYAVRLLAWVIRWPRLDVRITADDPEQVVGGLQFEVENTSPTICSLRSVVEERFLYPSKGRYVLEKATFDVRDQDRELPPFRAKMFSASARHLPPGYGHAWFKVYTFSPTRGVPRTLRVRNAMLQPVGRFRFWFEMWRFRLTGYVPTTGSMTHDEWEAIRRSHGPH